MAFTTFSILLLTVSAILTRAEYLGGDELFSQLDDGNQFRYSRSLEDENETEDHNLSKREANPTRYMAPGRGREPYIKDLQRAKRSALMDGDELYDEDRYLSKREANPTRYMAPGRGREPYFKDLQRAKRSDDDRVEVYDENLLQDRYLSKREASPPTTRFIPPGRGRVPYIKHLQRAKRSDDVDGVEVYDENLSQDRYLSKREASPPTTRYIPPGRGRVPYTKHLQRGKRSVDIGGDDLYVENRYLPKRDTYPTTRFIRPSSSRLPYIRNVRFPRSFPGGRFGGGRPTPSPTFPRPPNNPGRYARAVRHPPPNPPTFGRFPIKRG